MQNATLNDQPERRVGLIGSSDINAVNELRVKEYSKAGGFKVPRHAIEWNKSDEQSFVLGLWDENKLISTMRLEILDNQTMVERKLECPWTFRDISYPVMILSKAATDSNYRGEGLNTILRYQSLLLAQQWKVKFILGTFVSGSPRENLLRKLGYEFYENKLGWYKADYQSSRPVQVVVLDCASQIHKAIEQCRSIVEASPYSYDWLSHTPAIRFVDRIK